MTTYTPVQLAALAQSAGFSGPGLTRAVAVALAESGGDPAEEHTNSDGSIDRGLWQINSRWHPEVSAAEAFGPTTAAAAAYRISNGGASWSQWATWGNGAAAAEMGRATLAVAQLGNGTASQAIYIPGLGTIEKGVGKVIGGTGDLISGAASDVGSGLSGLAQIAKAVVKGAAWLANPHNWLRVVEVAAGVGVVVIGVKMLADSGIGGPVGAVARETVKPMKAYGHHLEKGKNIAEGLVGGGAAAKAAKGAGQAAKGAGQAAKEAAKGTG